VHYFPAIVTPEHLDRIEPWTIRRHIHQYQSPSGSADDRLNRIILVGIGIILRHVDRAGAMLRDQRFEQFGDLFWRLWRRTKAMVSPV